MITEPDVQRALAELTELITVGLESGDPVEFGAPYWAEKHRQLAQRLRDLEP